MRITRIILLATVLWFFLIIEGIVKFFYFLDFSDVKDFFVNHWLDLFLLGVAVFIILYCI